VAGARDEVVASSAREERRQRRPSCWGASEAAHGWRPALGTRQRPDLRRRQGARGGLHVWALGRRRIGGSTRAATGAWEACGLGPVGAPVTAARPGLSQVMPLHTPLNSLPHF
jgi:hypothetical protein